jgi:polyhydroxyalkanoate synthase
VQPDPAVAPVEVAPSPRAVVSTDGSARLLRFTLGEAGGPPVLLVPSLINRWYVLDLRRGASVVEALCRAGIDVYCLDWGVPEAEDRYLTWDDVVRRLGRAVRRVGRETGRAAIGLLGYCMGGTLAAIHTALWPRTVSRLVNLAGPIDFSRAGRLAEMVHPAWFDADAIADAGNVSAAQMQAGFAALRPTLALTKWVTAIDRVRPGTEAWEAFWALETWAADNIPFPAAAYRTYIRELYQENRLVAGTHHALGRRVDLADIDCPRLTVVATRDEICPPEAALALGGGDSISIPGGHVGAVVGRQAVRSLYPALTEFFASG